MTPTSQPSDDERISFLDAVRQCTGTAEDRRNRYWFLVATMIWAFSVPAATWILEARAGTGGGTSWLIALVPSFFAGVVLLTYLRFLRETDEFVRKVQVEGLAFGFGGGVVFGTGYEVLQSAGAPPLEPGMLVAVMMLIWVVGQLVGAWRYR